MSILRMNRSKTKYTVHVLHNGMITWNSLPDVFKVNLFFSMFRIEQGTKFLSRKILWNIDAESHYELHFFLTCVIYGFSSVIVLGFE